MPSLVTQGCVLSVLSSVWRFRLTHVEGEKKQALLTKEDQLCASILKQRFRVGGGWEPE